MPTIFAYLKDYITSRVEVDEKTGCWLWQKSIDENGYGRFAFNGCQYLSAHRATYELFVGEIPDGLQIDHKCRVRNCVNPNHLEAVSQRENVIRGISFAASNKRKTHCIHGHEFTPQNTYYRGDHRACRTCGREAAARYQARKFGAA